jgi:hypothetical protein
MASGAAVDLVLLTHTITVTGNVPITVERGRMTDPLSRYYAAFLSLSWTTVRRAAKTAPTCMNRVPISKAHRAKQALARLARVIQEVIPSIAHRPGG